MGGGGAWDWDVEGGGKKGGGKVFLTIGFSFKVYHFIFIFTHCRRMEILILINGGLVVGI